MEKVMISLAIAVALMGARMVAHSAVSNPAASNSAEGRAELTATASKTATPLPIVADAAERRADGTATAINAMAPLPLGGDHGMLTGAKADGRTIELDIQLSQNIPQEIPEDAFDRGLTAVTCKQKNITDLLGQGGAVRYVIAMPDGRVLNPVTVTSCPAAG